MYAVKSTVDVPRFVKKIGMLPAISLVLGLTVPSAWSTLGVNSVLSKRLVQLGLPEPLEVQQLAWPVVSTGADAVVVAEAGSGKTLSYLVPLVQLLLEPIDPSRSSRAVIALPSADLSAQVLGVAQKLVKGTKLVCAPAASAGSPRSDDSNIIVGTVRECLPYVFGPKGKKAAGAPAPVLTRLVIDEADLLMAGLRRKGRATTQMPVMEMLNEVKKGKKRTEGALGATGLSSKKKDDLLEKERSHQLILVSATVPAHGYLSIDLSTYISTCLYIYLSQHL